MTPGDVHQEVWHFCSAPAPHVEEGLLVRTHGSVAPRALHGAEFADEGFTASLCPCFLDETAEDVCKLSMNGLPDRARHAVQSVIRLFGDLLATLLAPFARGVPATACGTSQPEAPPQRLPPLGVNGVGLSCRHQAGARGRPACAE